MHQKGRSMVEMLGVLAIIGVLSVGALSGFNRAMEKHKLNEQFTQYTSAISGLIEHRDSFLQSFPNETRLTTYLKSFSFMPKWKMQGVYFLDSFSNTIDIYLRSDNLIFQVYYTEHKDFYRKERCIWLFQNVFQPFQNDVKYVALWSNEGQKTYYGNLSCTPQRQCLKDVTLSDIEADCETFKSKGNKKVILMAI